MSEFGDLREAELLAAANGDPFAWDGLVDRLLPDVWATALGFGLSEQDAVDVCHVVCVRLAQSLHELAGGDDIRGYVARLTEEECRRAKALALCRRVELIDLRDAAERRGALAVCAAAT